MNDAFCRNDQKNAGAEDIEHVCKRRRFRRLEIDHLADPRGFLTPAEAWAAAHVDENFLSERWGVDEEAAARRAARWREIEAAAAALRLLRDA